MSVRADVRWSRIIGGSVGWGALTMTVGTTFLFSRSTYDFELWLGLWGMSVAFLAVPIGLLAGVIAAGVSRLLYRAVDRAVSGPTVLPAVLAPVGALAVGVAVALLFNGAPQLEVRTLIAIAMCVLGAVGMFVCLRRERTRELPVWTARPVALPED
ncbi:hypothetical protein [Naasia aerilata]|nr:hypothetical protein [Naasia aerilata]